MWSDEGGVVSSCFFGTTSSFATNGTRDACPVQLSNIHNTTQSLVLVASSSVILDRCDCKGGSLNSYGKMCDKNCCNNYITLYERDLPRSVSYSSLYPCTLCVHTLSMYLWYHATHACYKIADSIGTQRNAWEGRLDVKHVSHATHRQYFAQSVHTRGVDGWIRC